MKRLGRKREEMKKLNLKNKILVAAVAIAAVGQFGGIVAQQQQASAATKVWVGDVRDYRERSTYYGVLQYDNTYYKTIRVPHGYDELAPTYSYGVSGGAEYQHWKYNYRIY